jgi:hypothetical protein
MTEPDDIVGGDGVEALRALEERLDRATRAAERLLTNAASGRAVPAAGWRAHAAGDGDGQAAPERWIEAADAELLLALATGMLGRIPTELQQRLIAALREVLTALRALIDWCLVRAERRRRAPAEVQDIPIL